MQISKKQKIAIGGVIAFIVVIGIFFLAGGGRTGLNFFSKAPEPSGEVAFLDMPGNKGKPVVIIKDGSFQPPSVTIKAGQSLIFMNNDSPEHSVVFEGFRSRKLRTNDTAEFIFKEPGTFQYHCGLNPGMTGTVIVQ